jgi:hypothetical protein
MSYRGACRHAARQRVWHARRTQKVTHQGSPEAIDAVIVATTAITTSQNHADRAAVTAYPPTVQRAAWRIQARCCFCGRRLSRFVRLGPLRGGP